MLAFLYAAKMDERVIHRLMGVGASFFQDNITKIDTGNFKVIFQRLQMVDDNQLEQHADSIAKSAVENRLVLNKLLLLDLFTSHNFIYCPCNQQKTIFISFACYFS